MLKSAEQLMTFSHANLDAVMRSGQILATGFQDIANQAAAATQSNVGDAMSALRAMAQLRSVKDAMAMQATLARSAMDRAMAQAGEIAGASCTLAGQAAAPIAERVSIAVETFALA